MRVVTQIAQVQLRFKKDSEREKKSQIDQVLTWHFAGIKRFSEHVYGATNNANAVKFLRELIAPYKVRSILVNGDSELMKDFEEACQEFAIPLFVIPPTKPTYHQNLMKTLSRNTIVGAKREFSKICPKI